MKSNKSWEKGYGVASVDACRACLAPLVIDVCICTHLFLVPAGIWHRVESRGQENEGYRGAEEDI